MCKSLETLKNNIAKGSTRLSKVTVKNIVNAGEFEKIKLAYYYDGYEVHRDEEIANPVKWFNEEYNCLDVSLSTIKDGIAKIHLTIHSNLWYDLYIDLNKDYNKKETTPANEIFNDTELTITLNEEKNGIELRFTDKPDSQIRTQLKENGFRWSKNNNCWYAKQTTDRIYFANELVKQINKNETTKEVVNDIHTDGEIETIELNTIEDAEIINNIEIIGELEEVATTEEEKLIDAMDFNNIETLKNKYITNWNVLPEELQIFILSCDKYWVNLQSVELYKNNKIVASIGVSRWEDTIEINSIGASELFQWNTQDGFTVNNLIQESSNVDYNDSEVKTWEETFKKYEPINFENIEVIETLTKNIFVNCLIPRLNKNCNKAENDKEIQESSYLNKFQVQRIVKLNSKQYNYFINNLLHDYSFLTGLGGWEQDEQGKLLYYYGVAVICDDQETLIIDPSGCSYARYCCQLIEDINNNLQTELNNINSIIQINNNLYKDAIDSIVNNEFYQIKVSDKIVVTDNRYIKNIPYNGLTVVTGLTIKELITEQKGIDVLNLKPLKMSIESFMNGLKKHDNKEVFSLFPTEMDKQLEEIKFLDRLEYELSRAKIKENKILLS